VGAGAGAGAGVTTGLAVAVVVYSTISTGIVFTVTGAVT